MVGHIESYNGEFLSTLPARGATPRIPYAGGAGAISIHAPREGSDPSRWRRSARPKRFLSTLPARGATDCGLQRPAFIEISIHAPREGSDPSGGKKLWASGHFYPRSPRGERPRQMLIWPARKNFYPRSPRGERPGHLSTIDTNKEISIHAPREGSDLDGRRCPVVVLEISIHAPREGSDLTTRCMMRAANISIHAPREGSDHGTQSGPERGPDFYPRSPRGERRAMTVVAGITLRFLSTLPARGATAVTEDGTRYGIISIHAPREGSDAGRAGSAARPAPYFYPRSPRGERPTPPPARCREFYFYPRSPRRERPTA